MLHGTSPFDSDRFIAYTHVSKTATTSIITTKLLIFIFILSMIQAPKTSYSVVNYPNENSFFVTEMDYVPNYDIEYKENSPYYFENFIGYVPNEFNKLPRLDQVELTIKRQNAITRIRKEFAEFVMSKNKRINAILEFKLQFEYFKNKDGKLSETEYSIKAFGYPAIVTPRKP